MLMTAKPTVTGKTRDRICGINTRRSRAIGDIFGLRLHPQANPSLPLHPKRRAHKHRGQDAEAGCIINRQGGANRGNRFSEENDSIYFSNFKIELSLKSQATDNRPSTSNGVYINNFYTVNLYTNMVKPLEV